MKGTDRQCSAVSSWSVCRYSLYLLKCLLQIWNFQSASVGRKDFPRVHKRIVLSWRLVASSVKTGAGVWWPLSSDLPRSRRTDPYLQGTERLRERTAEQNRWGSSRNFYGLTACPAKCDGVRGQQRQKLKPRNPVRKREGPRKSTAFSERHCSFCEKDFVIQESLGLALNA